jgi:hypothetical protein
MSNRPLASLESAGAPPLIQFDPAGQAPILSYNVPDATSYHGQSLIELELPEDVFKPALRAEPPTPRDPPSAPRSQKGSAKAAAIAPGGAVSGRRRPLPVRPDPKTGKFTAIGGGRFSNRLLRLDAEEVARMQAAGRRLVIRKNMFGRLDFTFVPEPVRARPRLLLVESYRLSSFPTSYGAGKVLKTLTLLPGERTKISVKTFQKTESEQKEASSILDSFSEESAEDFEESVQSEVSDKQNQAENLEYSLEAEGEQSWGTGSAKATAGVKGGSNSAREEFAKNVTNALHKHATKASSKRDVQVNSSFEVKEQAGEETSIEREIQNLNVSRTLNFVFRQMNQAFISLVHLVDVRVGFFNGFTETREEVALADLDGLLERVIVDEPRRKTVKAAILDQLQNVLDHRGVSHSIVETATLRDAAGQPVPGSSYLRVKRDLTTTFSDPVTGAAVAVPGIIVAQDSNVLRTDGIIVESLLGQGESLDDYSKHLQQETIRAKILENELTDARLRREREIARILESRDELGAAIYARMFPPAAAASPDEPVKA